MSIVEHRKYSDAALSVIELGRVPFQVRRIFWISDVRSGDVRGNHAHRTCHQVLVPIYGTFFVSLEWMNMEGELETESRALSGGYGAFLYVPPMRWITIEYQTFNSILLVLASEEWNPNEAIKDHDEFVALLKEME